MNRKRPPNPHTVGMGQENTAAQLYVWIEGEGKAEQMFSISEGQLV